MIEEFDREPPVLTEYDPIKVKWEYETTKPTQLLLRRFLIHDSHLERHKPFRAGERLQKRGLDSRMIEHDWVTRDGILQEDGAALLNYAAEIGFDAALDEIQELGPAGFIREAVGESHA